MDIEDDYLEDLQENERRIERTKNGLYRRDNGPKKEATSRTDGDAVKAAR